MRIFEVRAGEIPTWPGITPAGRAVAEFLCRVRVTGDTDAAVGLMTPTVRCHQMNSESPQTIERSPAEYAAHVREMLADFGQFSYVVTEFLSEDDRVYVRWKQTGPTPTPTDDGTPGLPLVEVGSAVYRVHDGRIAEYWIQLDRHGLLIQLGRLHATSSDPGAQAIQPDKENSP